MATIKELLSTYKVGQRIEDKRILAYFKRLGFIWDYSRWGNLESIVVNACDYNAKCCTLFPKGNAKELEKLDGAMWHKWRQSSCKSDMNYNDITSKYSGGSFKWDKYVFTKVYVSGCFASYLSISKID